MYRYIKYITDSGIVYRDIWRGYRVSAAAMAGIPASKIFVVDLRRD